MNIFELNPNPTTVNPITIPAKIVFMPKEWISISELNIDITTL